MNEPDTRDPDSRRDLIACYAVGALDADERAAVDRLLDPTHPAFDPDLRDELDAYRETLAALAPDAEPPAGLLDRILADLPARPAAPAVSASTAPVVDLATRRAAARPRAWAWAAVAAAAAVIVAVIGVGLLADDEPGDLREVALAALEDPDATVLELTAPDGDDRLARAALQDDGSGYLVVDDLPELAPGEVYQLWMLPDGEAPPISLGLVDGEPDGVTAFHMEPGAAGIAVSHEPAGLAVAPTQVVAAGRVT
jgi:anti-sigma-K factor RskA